MIKKKVYKYWCEFCGKTNCSAASIKKHEKRCTKNPNRECGYCKLLEQEQPNIAELVAMLPKPVVVIETDYCGEHYTWTGIKEILPIIREKTGGCPACIMAVFRQGGIPIPLVEGFDFQKECQEIWSEFNRAQQKENYY